MPRVDKTTNWADWWNNNPQISVEDRYSTLLVALAQTRKGTKKHKELTEFISIIDNPKNYKMEKGGMFGLGNDMMSKANVDAFEVYDFMYDKLNEGKKFKSAEEVFDEINQRYATGRVYQFSKKSVEAGYNAFKKDNYAKGGNIEKLDKISKALKKGSKTHKKQSEQLENASKLHKKQSDELEKIADKLEKMEKGGMADGRVVLASAKGIGGNKDKTYKLIKEDKGIDAVGFPKAYYEVREYPSNSVMAQGDNFLDVNDMYKLFTGNNAIKIKLSKGKFAKGGEVVEPMIYVASLTDYNNGKLVGEFFKFSDYNDEDELLDGITDYLEGLTEEFDDGEIREEFAIHDYEGFPREYYSEYMGLEDFKQIYDFIRISEEIDLPMDIVMERASDTGYEDPDDIIDDYNDYYEQSIDGDDPSDYVYELEMAGVLGIEFFSNHIYITPTDLRIMYSEDVDRFYDELQYDNPDEDEDELYRQAEERADEMQEIYVNDLENYIQDYYGGEIPNFVSKDYDSAWNDLSYDYSTYYDSENDRTHIFRN